METSNDQLAQLILKLQNIVPQYVLGCIPAITTIGAAPDDGLRNKMLWLLRCLGCPFVGLYYTLNIKSDDIGLSTYWLRFDQFAGQPAGQQPGQQISYRPVGRHAKEIRDADQDQIVLQLLKECIAEASVLDRLSSLASAYYIFVGIFAGITRAVHEVDSCVTEDWPLLPLALAWTLPAIFRRVLGRKLVVKDPRALLDEYNKNNNNNNISVVVNDLANRGQDSEVVYAAIILVLFSIIIPWITVLLAYFTRPVGYGCRSKYITLLCSIWTFNNIVACISHYRGEKFVNSNILIHVLFCLSGVFIGILLILLALLSYTPSWWIHLFGASCIICPSKNI